MIVDRNIGASIKHYMKDNGISQTYVSSKTKIPISILNAVLNSKRNLLAEEYFLICEVLGVPLDTFKERKVV